MDEAELKELASQLRKPDGPKGLETAELMNDTNTPMTTNTVDLLGLETGHRVLELGYGNGDHLRYVLEKADNVTYAGLDISSTMCEEAQRRNAEFCQAGRATFDLYDGQNIGFDDRSFDRVFTVNTIYFWTDVLGLLNELCRVLEPGGAAAIAFVQKEFMKTLPFTEYGFKFFDHEAIAGFVEQSNFEEVQIVDLNDIVTSKSGEKIERHYSIATLTN